MLRGIDIYPKQGLIVWTFVWKGNSFWFFWIVPDYSCIFFLKENYSLTSPQSSIQTFKGSSRAEDRSFAIMFKQDEVKNITRNKETICPRINMLLCNLPRMKIDLCRGTEYVIQSNWPGSVENIRLISFIWWNAHPLVCMYAVPTVKTLNYSIEITIRPPITFRCTNKYFEWDS